MTQTNPLSPEQWIQDLFSSRAAMEGRVIRRQKRDIVRFAGLERFLAEVDRRGYLAVENVGQIIVFCNMAPVKRLSSLRLQRRRDPVFLERPHSRDFDSFRRTGSD